MNMTGLKTELEAIASDNQETKLKRAVAEMLIDQSEEYTEPRELFQDIQQHGCISGLIGGLIYYKDTHAFAKEHIEDILELYQEAREQGSEINIPYDTDALNWLAWFGFEETAYHISGLLELD